MDKIDAERRSRNMAAIKRTNTSIELTLRSALWSAGVRGYRIDAPTVPGRPDLAFGPSKVAVFVDGCFWHKCPDCYREPKSNTAYWRAKITRTVERDRNADATLRDQGWTIVRIWEHEVEDDLESCVERIRYAVTRARG